MKLKLLGAPLSPFVRKAILTLKLKELPYELTPVLPFNFPDWFVELNPLKRIPVLTANDTPIADSSVICQFLDTLSDTTRLIPDNPLDAARVRWFEKYADYELAPHLTFTIFRNRFLLPSLGKPGDEAAIEKSLTVKLPPMLTYLEQTLADNDYLVGDSITLADIAILSQFISFRHGGEQPDSNQYPLLCAYLDRLMQLPAVVETWEKECAIIQKMKK